MDIGYLLSEIDAIFSPFDIPSYAEFVPEFPHYIESEEICTDMEEFRGKEVSGKVIRTIHRYLPVLSAKSTRWILPHYLRFCLTEEAQKHSRMEAASLIYALSPYPEFQSDTKLRLALLNMSQITCLIHFLEWCLADEYWIESESERIRAGIEFLMSINPDCKPDN